MRGEGQVAESIRQMFKLAVRKYMGEPVKFEYDLSIFKRKGHEQLSLF
jgi:hypothetical protein